VPKDAKELEIRQHPKLGIYIPGLTESASSSFQDVDRMMEFGQKTRSVAATSMNDRSSRSHCIFIFHMTQLKGPDPNKPLSQLKSRVNLVDLAGSEGRRRRKLRVTD
jgi:kinesin family protein 1